MSAAKERWMMIGTFTLAIIVVFCFAWPNYRTARTNVEEAGRLEDRISRLERRQVEVGQMRSTYKALEQRVQDRYKHVPTSPNTAQIVQVLSLDVDGIHVLDQSFVAGSTSKRTTYSGEDMFSVQPLAITIEADFNSIFSVIRKAESMDRLIRVSSIRISSQPSENLGVATTLEAAVGLHAPFDPREDH